MKWLKVKILLGLIRFLSLFPLKFHYFMAGCLPWIMNNVIHYRRDVVMTNLARSFPEKKYRELSSIADEFYRHFAEIIAEAIWFGGSDYRRLHESEICRYTNAEVLREAYLNSPSVTVLSSHCGNWELLGGLWTYNYDENVVLPGTEHNVKVVYKKLNNPVWDEVMKRNRCAPIKGYRGEIESSNILRYVLNHRDDRFIYIYPTDQYPYAGAYDIGTFLNQKTYAMLGGAKVAHKTGMSVLYMKMKRVSKGHYEITFIPICENASEKTPEWIVRRFYDLLEEEIRQTPSNYLWTHKRWKH